MKKTIELKCKVCGKKFKKILSEYKADSKKCNAGKFCSQKCFYKSPERSPNKGRFREKSFGWKGGVFRERGYRMVLAQDHPYGVAKGGGLKYVREHRLVIEKQLGRYLTNEEVVHHINGIVDDNCLENLFLTTSSKHSQSHKNNYWKEYYKLHPIVINFCIGCGKPISKRGKRCHSCAKKGNLNPSFKTTCEGLR